MIRVCLPVIACLLAAVELVNAQNPPPVQMLVPGFEVYELPIELTNVNNVRFRTDGRLVTLGYNGDIHLLDDSDGDGLEDHAQLFWKNEGSLRGPIGMLLTPPGYAHGQGVFTPSKGKLSLIVDQDGDDRADKEIVVASGWQEIPQNVDATGIAMDQAGYLYFGLGTANYANAYLIDEQGVAHYDVHSDRGTVQRVSPDFKTRETVASGIRFPIAFAFNAAGDLFCTEQEGATWLPNGNPFDELLHIRPGKHYGFPPRHPRHNPDVIDEPSLFDYAPQHQSTCGMVFNQSVYGGPVFGPAWWAGDALVCGESRGKLWRTQLVSTKHGYVAATQLIAGLQMLTVDACVAPNGDLLVACHSGPPDWGTGPTGMGKLFRVRMTAPHVARPTQVWANTQREIQIAFDQPLDASVLQGIADQIQVEFGETVRAGDEFETLVPPYAEVQRQRAAPRHQLAVHGLALSSDRRNILLQTEPMLANAHYAISIPLSSAASEPVGDRASEQAAAQATQAQRSVIEVDFSLTGVHAKLEVNEGERDGQTLWTGWLPHFDWRVNQELTRQSAVHDALRLALRAGGRLCLESRLDLQNILRPAVQPGAELDAPWPQEIVRLRAEAAQPMALVRPDGQLQASRNAEGRYQAEWQVPIELASGYELEMHLELAAGDQPDCCLSVSTNEDPAWRPLPLHRFFLPWSASSPERMAEAPVLIAEIAGGNWGRGRRVFNSQAASCFKCHAAPGSKLGPATSGQPTLGPDLSNLVHRDYASVLRDIQFPSFAINPDYLGQIVLLRDGRILTGVLQTRQGQLILGDAEGHRVQLAREEIESIKAAEVSIMPQGVHEKLNAEQLRDLMTFLLTPPPQMPLDSPLSAPPLRTAAEVAAVLADSQPLPTELRDINIVLVAGQKDHGPGEHDYPAWQQQWGQLMAAAEHVNVEAAWEFPDEGQLATADLLVFFQKGKWNDARQASMDAFFERGGGAVYIHWAVNGDDRVADLAQRIGLASKGGSISYRHGPLDLQVHNTDHPIMRNIEPLQLYDESYWRLTGNADNVTLFASSLEDGAAQPQLWCYERGKGRVFVSIPGHYSWTFDDPFFRALLLRGMAWSIHEPIDRFNELVTPGARMSH